jgi:hypothetical protein
LDQNNRINGNGAGGGNVSGSGGHASIEKDMCGSSSFKATENIRKLSSMSISALLFSKKQIDHSLYWKEIVQDYAKNLDDSAREKDIHKEQAYGLLFFFLYSSFLF